MISKVVWRHLISLARAILLGIAATLLLNTSSLAVLLRDPAADCALADALFTNASLLHFKIELSSNHVDALRRAPREYVPGTLTEGTNVYTDVAFHLKGSAGSFRRIDQKPGWTLNFNTFEASSRFYGLKKFHLNNCAQDPTYLSEWLCTEIFRQAGVPASRVAHAVVELNGRKLGLYTLMEANNSDFLARYFKNTRGNLYGQSRGGDIFTPLERMEGKDPLDRADLQALTEAAQETDLHRRWLRLQETLDVDKFLSFMALELMLTHVDGYTLNRHNYRVYQDLDTGRMVFIPHDMDRMMIRPTMPLLPPVNGLVAQAIVNTLETRQLYRQRCGYLFTNLFNPAEITNRLAQYVALILPQLESCDSTLARQFENGARTMSDRVLNRYYALRDQVAFLQPKPLEFSGNIAKPRAWEAYNQGRFLMERTRYENKSTLHIRCERGRGLASWRVSVLLPPGKYSFSGLAKCSGIDARLRDAEMGGWLAIWGSTSSRRLIGDSPWTRLECNFELTKEGEVVLLCELRAMRGAIWFDLDSLQITRKQ